MVGVADNPVLCRRTDLGMLLAVLAAVSQGSATQRAAVAHAALQTPTLPGTVCSAGAVDYITVLKVRLAFSTVWTLLAALTMLLKSGGALRRPSSGNNRKEYLRNPLYRQQRISQLNNLRSMCWVRTCPPALPICSAVPQSGSHKRQSHRILHVHIHGPKHMHTAVICCT